MILLDLTGRKFGRLTVLSRMPNRGKEVYWHCLCQCGNTKAVNSRHIRTGKIVSCCCYRDEAASKRNYKHGSKKNGAVYRAWRHMRERCLNETDKEYKNYGARGITVCERWNDFLNFLSDMGHPPKGHLIGRIDNDGNYEPSNCRWETAFEQARNRRTNCFIEFDGIIKCATDWGTPIGLSGSAITRRIKRGWSIEKALFTPPIPLFPNKERPMAYGHELEDEG